MTLMDKACYERGCICYDSQDQNEFVEVVTKAALEEALAKQGEPDYKTLAIQLQQQRTWVGLTDVERSQLVTLHHGWNEYGKAIEAKLKELNT